MKKTFLGKYLNSPKDMADAPKASPFKKKKKSPLASEFTRGK